MKYIFWIGICLIFSTACNENRVFLEKKEIPRNAWAYSEIPSFKVEVPDITQKYNLIVRLRHATFYPYQNLWAIVRIQSPSGKMIMEERKEWMLANNEGRFFGECMGEICDLNIPLFENYTFEEAGKYTFSFEQNMRDEQLPGVMAVALEVVRVNP